MSIECINYEASRGPTNSSTKEYYTTHWQDVKLKCLDCGEDLSHHFQYGVEPHEVEGKVNGAIRVHRNPDIMIRWKEHGESV